jgi:putative endonuclease
MSSTPKAKRGRVSRWTVYIVHCADGSLYAGIARDVARRVEEHNSNNLLAANYTRARRPVVLVYQELAATRSTALKREHQIKQMSRREKETLVLGRIEDVRERLTCKRGHPYPR